MQNSVPADRMKTALDFIEGIKHESSMERTLKSLRDLGSQYGFDSFLLTGVPNPGRRMDGYIMLSGWNQTWLEHYLKNDYVQVDPVARRLRGAAEPFVWSEAIAAMKEIRPEEQRVMDEAAELGMRDGFCVPVYDLDGRQSVLSMAAHKVDLDEADRGMLHLVGIYVQNRVRELITLQPAAEAPRLSRRERECLQWIAEGKTSWEISGILSISESTAEWYITCATRKLGASNRAQAVAIGMRHGLIH